MPTVEQLCNVVCAWSEVFTRAEECEKLLLDNGCRAFLPIQNFYLQFTDRPEDAELHKRLGRETGRRGTMPSLLVGGLSSENRDRWYRPPLWDQGRTALAKQAGFSSVDAWVAALNPSVMELNPDPVRQSMWRKLGMINSPPSGQMKPYQDAAMAGVRVALAEEGAGFPACHDRPFSPEQRQQAACELSSRYLAGFGFKPAKTRLRSYVAFDLDVSSKLILRWSIGDGSPDFLAGWSEYCRPELHLRERSFTKRAADADTNTQCLEIVYVNLVEGMQSGYCVCQDEGEMEAIFHAHSLVVGWLLPHLVKSVHDHIPNEQP